MEVARYAKDIGSFFLLYMIRPAREIRGYETVTDLSGPAPLAPAIAEDAGLGARRIETAPADESVIINNAVSNPERDDGFLCYKKWWFRREVDISVNGEKITGTPIFIESDTVRLVNERHSYFIPLCKVDYIRTNDGLCTVSENAVIEYAE